MVFEQINDAKHYVPQHRERIFVAGFNKEYFSESVIFKFPDAPKKEHKVSDILEKNPDSKYTLSDNLWNYLQAYATKHQTKRYNFKLIIKRNFRARYYKFKINGRNNDLGVTLPGRAFRSNLLFVPHKRISTAIPNAKPDIK